MPTHGIGRYKYLLPKQLPKKKRKDKMQIKQINPGTETVYGTLNVLVSGYDMTLVEHYSQYVHNLCNRLKIKVDESYALPTKTTELILVQEQGTKIHVDSVLKTHKRVVQVSDLSSTLAPVFLEVLLRNQPEGVELLVKEPTVLKEMREINYRPLTQIFQMTLRTGDVPTDWKTANVIPVHKKEDKTEPGNYRPMCLTCITCKIIRQKIEEHLNEMNSWRRELSGHVYDVNCCKFLPSGMVVISGGMDAQVKVWSCILDLAAVDRGRNVVSCSRDGTARLWDCGKSACLAVVADCGPPINGCCVGVAENSINLGAPEEPTSDREIGTQDKLLLLAREDKKLQGIGLQSRQPIFAFDGSDAFNCCTFLSSVYVLAGTQDGNIYKLDVRCLRTPVQIIHRSGAPVHSLLPFREGFVVSQGKKINLKCFSIPKIQLR
ncbi:PAAF1 factor, partial [Amia calva]|nr:PAAF1 factor [Amia calva]